MSKTPPQGGAQRPGGSTGAGPGFMNRGMMPGMGAGDKPKDFKGTMKRLAGYTRRYWASMLVVLIFAIVSTIFFVVSPKILGNMTNKVFDDYTNMQVYDHAMAEFPEGFVVPPGTTGADLLKNAPSSMKVKIPADTLERVKKLDFSKRPGIDFESIERTALILIALYLLSTFFNYVQGWVMTGVAQKTTYHLRREMSEKIKRMPLKYFDTRTHGEILSRVTNDVDLVNQTLSQSAGQAITSVTMLVGILAMMFSINWLLTLVSLLVLPLSFGFIGIIMKRSQQYFMLQQKTLGQMNGHIEEMYSGHSVMKVFNGEKRSMEAFGRINNELYGSAWKSQFLSGLMMPIMFFIGNLGYVGVCVVGGWLAINGTVKIGDIQAFIQYVRQFNQPITQAASVAGMLQSTAAAAERVFEFLDGEEEVPESTGAVEPATARGAVEFNDVVFGYDEDKTIIKSFSAKIKPGQKVAIVGPTGAGKTTMVNLLMRFYDVGFGSIKIDGVDIREIKRADLRRTFGMVLQDTWLFNGTIKENIGYGDLSATDDEIIAAAQAAHADHFIHALPGGYEMLLNEEADNISQGEKQLLTIARAMLADPPMLILDEATSSVDTRTEVLIQKAMERLMEGRTSFVIAHRLSTIRDADLILVMDDGNIVEQGTHGELIAAGGFYAQLYNSQFTVPAGV